MTVQSLTDSVSYTLPGILTPLPVTFRFLENADLRVVHAPISGATPTELVLNTDYTVTGARTQGGGSVTLLISTSAGDVVSIDRGNMSRTQLIDYRANDPFPEEDAEDGLDRLTMLLQQAGIDGGRRSLTLFPTDPITGGRYNANNNRIVGLADGIAPTDAATVQQVIGAGSGNFIQSGAGAVTRTMQNKVREIISVKDYGAVGDGVVDDTEAFQNAIAFLETNSDTRGGTIKVPRGIYKINQTLAFTAYAAGLVHNIELVGDGILNTSLDFSGAPALSDGITFNKGTQFSVRDIAIANPKRDGISINIGSATGGPDYCSIFNICRVRIQGAVRDGIRCVNAYLGTIEECWSKNNGGHGFNFGGFHTSMKLSRCEASENVSIGYVINGFTYSAFDNCGSDSNGLQGWAISNVQGLTLQACGSESNGRDGFFVFTSAASAAGLNAQSWDVHGLVFESCYGLANSTASIGTYATFVGVTTSDVRPAEILIKGGASHPGTASDRALILAGASGSIALTKELFFDNAFTAADGISGSTEVKNLSMIGRRCMLQQTGAQSIPDGGADTMINNWNTTPILNDLGATVSASTIIIPRGVNKVRVVANSGWENDGSTGQRTSKIFKNGAGFPGIAADQRSNQTFSLTNISTPPISVVAGDTFSLVVSQNSGGARNTLGVSNSMYLCVEVLG